MSTPANSTAGAVRTHHVVEGSGPWVVLIHGVGLDLYMWSRQTVALQHRYRVLRYDLIGHGATPAAGEELLLSDLVTQLRDLLNMLGIERTAIVGFSLGALVAQAFTLAHAGMVEKLALLNAVHARSEEARANVCERLDQVQREGITSSIEASITRWFTENFRQQQPDEIEKIAQRLRNNDPDGFLSAYRMFAGEDHQLIGRLEEIRVPTLVITGEHDVGSTPEMAMRMSEEIPSAVLRIFKGVRHMLPVEAAAELNTLLNDFLSRKDE